MPAQVVMVLQDDLALGGLANAIRANGHTVQPFTDPMDALTALEQAKRVELLITCLQFPPGKPNGQALARMARMKRPGIKCIFVVMPGEGEHVEDMGDCVPMPVDVPRIAALAEELLSRNGV